MSTVVINLVEGADRNAIYDRKYTFETSRTATQDVALLSEIPAYSGLDTLPTGGDYIYFNADTNFLDVYIQRGAVANLSSAALNSKINSIIMRLLPNGTGSPGVPGFFPLNVTIQLGIDPASGAPNFYYGTAVDNPGSGGGDEGEEVSAEYDYSGWVIGRKA